MRLPTALVFFILFSGKAKAQTNIDSALSEMEKDKHEIFNSRIYSLADIKKGIRSPTSKIFESQGMYHSTYLILNADSSFVYYSVYEGGFDLTVGRCIQFNGDTLALNWDRDKTLDYINDKKKYEKYFQYSHPSFVPMINWLIKKSKTKIEPVISIDTTKTATNSVSYVKR